MSEPTAAAPDAPAVATPAPAAPAEGGDVLAELGKLRTDAKEAEPPAKESDAEPAAAIEDSPAVPSVVPTPNDPPPPADPQFSKNLAALQAERQKNIREANTRKAELDKQAAELATHRDAVKEWQTARERVHTDLYGFLSKSGMDAAKIEKALELAYYTLKDPKRAADARLLVENETRIERIEREQRERDAQLEKKEQAFAQRERVNAEKGQLRTMIPALAAKAPLVAKCLANDEGYTLDGLYQAIPQYVEEHGEAPTGEQLIEYVEQLTRKQLARFGIDAAALNKPAADAPAKPQTPVADAKKTAKTLGNELGNPTRPKAAKSRDEEYADVLAEMKAGRVTAD